MNWPLLIAFVLAGLGITVLVIPLVLKASRLHQLGRERDLHHTHSQPIPRRGGVALAAAFVAAELVIAFTLPEYHDRIPNRWVYIAGSLAMFGLGFWDDLKPLGAKRKLLGQVLLAGLVVYAGCGIHSLKCPFTNRIVELHGWGFALSVFWLVGITNLVNLIDGVDGLAGGICLLLMVLLVYVGHETGSFFLLTGSMAGALLGFLGFNFPPARIYLGDGGAYFLGFQIALFSLVSSHKGTVAAALWAPAFALALPIVDTALAVLRRGLKGLPVFRPDRHHLHHRLAGLGYSRRQVVLVCYGFTLVFLAMGFAVFWSRGQLFLVLAGLGVLILLGCAQCLSFARPWFAVRQTLAYCFRLRQDVLYARAVADCLARDGQRCRSLEEAFELLAFSAGRLGFRSVKLTLADGERLWQAPGNLPAQWQREERLGANGILQMSAAGPLLDPAPIPFAGPGNCFPGGETGQRYDILFELLAEAWLKGAKNWRVPGEPLRFVTHPMGAPRACRHLAPAPLPVLPPALADGGMRHLSQMAATKSGLLSG